MVIINEAFEVWVQAALVEYEHVIQALAADGSDHPFDISTLPRRPWRREHLFDVHCCHPVDEVYAEDALSIP